MKTRITDLLGIEYPIFQGGMAWVAEQHLAAAVSAAGGLGLLGGASAPGEVVRDMIRDVRSMTDRPFGVNVVKNPIATIDLAAATGASFARNSFSGAYVGEYGLFSTSSGEAARHRMALGIPEMKLLYKVNPESDAYLASRDLRVVARSILYGGFADGLCVSGAAAGSEPDDSLLAAIYEVARGSGVPVFCNTGCKQENVQEKLKYCDAVCMGTAFKGPDGRVQKDRVSSFMEKVARIRAAL